MIDLNLMKIVAKEKLFDFGIWLSMKTCVWGTTYDTLDTARLLENTRRSYEGNCYD